MMYDDVGDDDEADADAKSHQGGGQVRSGQVRPARQWRARFRAQAQKHNMYTTAIYMRQKFTNEGKCEFHTTSSSSLHDPKFAYLQYA